MVWSAFARVVAEGRKTLPAHAGTASVVGASVGLLLVLADRTRLGRFTPSGIGLGLAMVVPAMYCVPIFLGSLGKVLFRALSRERHDSYYVSVASGGIAGEGLAGILVAALRFAGVLSGS
jgi:uncharacterized oligopeptide transporter (OPT) family protein